MKKTSYGVFFYGCITITRPKNDGVVTERFVFVGLILVKNERVRRINVISKLT